MRLLNTRTHHFTSFFDEDAPSYAILSHRWEGDETTLQEFEGLQQTVNGSMADVNANAIAPAGVNKALKFCEFCVSNHIDWVWIDTCCIDKTSSAELSEAINSMYYWYSTAKICYVFMSDVEGLPSQSDTDSQTIPGSVNEAFWDEFRHSQWFTRGWTLQELLAPRHVTFLNKAWQEFGTKQSLSARIREITAIDEKFLQTPEMIHEASVATRMSWAAKRQTKRLEDMAYCLLGLFEINMPMLYGERRQAFLRLQLEIIKRTNDESMFAWTTTETCSGLLAEWPSAFIDSANINPRYINPGCPTHQMSNKGLEIYIPASENRSFMSERQLILNCTRAASPDDYLVINLSRNKNGAWYRTDCSSFGRAEQLSRSNLFKKPGSEPIYVEQYKKPPAGDDKTV